jgi:2-polyprenyl-3-methyl-5-hydroxy-6-metoxy-1,4-benzoquinol methylase
VNKIYLTGEYIAANPTYHVEDSGRKAAEILLMLRKHQLRPSTVCEVGCGAGEILRLLQFSLPPDASLHGFDISTHAIKLAQTRENARLRFHCQDFFKTEGGPFELLLCLDVIEHVEDYFGFLRGLRDRAELKLFHFPLDMTAQMVARAHKITEVRKTLGHLHYFSKETALFALQDTGYQVLDWHLTSFAARSWKSQFARLPRRALACLNLEFTIRVLGGYAMMVLAR